MYRQRKQSVLARAKYLLRACSVALSMSLLEIADLLMLIL